MMYNDFISIDIEMGRFGDDSCDRTLHQTAADEPILSIAKCAAAFRSRKQVGTREKRKSTNGELRGEVDEVIRHV